jgi:hypothetical protein
MMKIVPITFRYAQQFVKDYHRHNPNVVGCKFAIGCQGDNGIVGVAICGRPVSRYLDDGKTLEINRVCTNGAANACSMLYGACCRIAKEMGYERVITYTLQSETGASVKASNFICDGEAGGTHWTGKRDKGQNIPNEMKVRWHRDL